MIRDDGGEGGAASTRMDTRKWDFRCEVNSAKKERTNSSITRHARVPHISYPVRLGAALVRWWTINHEFYRPFHPRAFTGNGAILFLHSIQSRRRLDGLKSCTDRRMFERCEHPPGVFWDNINARNSKFSPRLKQTDERKWERERKEFDFRCHDIYMYNFRSRVCVSKGEESSIFLSKRVTFNRTKPDM